MIKKKLCISFSFFVISLINYADAQECNPKDFTIQDVERLDFSDTIKYSAYSTLDKSQTDQKSQGISGGAVIYGVPVNLNWSDARAVSDHILSSSGFNLDRDTKLNYVRTALSAIGRDMYADCLGAKNIRVEIPLNAYSTMEEFFVTITWTPQHSGGDTANLTVSSIGGTIDGKSMLESTLKRYEGRPFRVRKSSNSTTQISIVVSGERPYPLISIPPNAATPKFAAVKRFGVSNSPRQGVGDVCTDHAYLVDEKGSAAGQGPRSCRLCVDRSADGILLPSTANVEGQLGARGSHMEVERGSNNYLEMCGYFHTDGAGTGSGRFEVKDGRFYVWEAIPQR